MTLYEELLSLEYGVLSMQTLQPEEPPTGYASFQEVKCILWSSNEAEGVEPMNTNGPTNINFYPWDLELVSLMMQRQP